MCPVSDIAQGKTLGSERSVSGLDQGEAMEDFGLVGLLCRSQKWDTQAINMCTNSTASVCVHVCMCTYVYMYVCAMLYTHVYMYAYTYVYTAVFWCLSQSLSIAF